MSILMDFPNPLKLHRQKTPSWKTKYDILIITGNCVQTPYQCARLKGLPLINITDDLCLIAVPGTLVHYIVMRRQTEIQ